MGSGRLASRPRRIRGLGDIAILPNPRFRTRGKIRQGPKASHKTEIAKLDWWPAARPEIVRVRDLTYIRRPCADGGRA
jgi:hypothetical protein